jgi:hypothetical protein
MDKLLTATATVLITALFASCGTGGKSGKARR